MTTTKKPNIFNEKLKTANIRINKKKSQKRIIEYMCAIDGIVLLNIFD